MTDKITTIEGQKLKLTNLEKELWPGITKLDLISYFDSISEYILPYLKDRPLSLKRFPDGISGEHFFQKNIAEYKLPWMKTRKIKSETDNETVEYLICNDKATLIYLANLAAIEIHPWLSRTQNLSKPDWLLLDLDPEDTSFDKVVEVAKKAKKILDRLKIEAFIKTSGVRGLHILIPTAAKYDYGQVRTFAEILARMIHKEIPAFTSVERLPEKRRKKVYLDYLQNSLGQTMIAPYCTRAVDHATISTPLKWEELDQKIYPKDFTIKTIKSRLNKIKDPLGPVFKSNPLNIEKVLKKI